MNHNGDLLKALEELRDKGYLKKTKKGWVDSDRTKELLKEGKSRKEISKILDREYKRNKKHEQR
jgi:hypothetical protein